MSAERSENEIYLDEISDFYLRDVAASSAMQRMAENDASFRILQNIDKRKSKW